MSAPPVLSESPPPPVFFPEPDLGELLRQAWDLIRRRAWIVLVVIAVMVAGALARARLQVPVYQATATLIIEPEVPHVANPWDFLLGDSPSFYNSQYEILRSFGIARRATEVLGLEPTPETVAALRGRIRVEPVADSRLVRIRSRGSDPAVLAQEVNCHPDPGAGQASAEDLLEIERDLDRIHELVPKSRFRFRPPATVSVKPSLRPPPSEIPPPRPPRMACAPPAKFR